MKHKKIILIFSLITILISYIIFPYIFSKREETAFKNNDDIIRFHVIANSDSPYDQELKLKIRDRILDEVGGEFGQSKDIEQSRKIIQKNIGKIKNIAQTEIKEEGKDYDVKVSLGNDTFPTKTYGDMTFPAGEYEALKVVIGEGKGKNWWCVMFPPLCFVDITHSETSMGQEQDIVLKSKIVELLEKTKVQMAKMFVED